MATTEAQKLRSKRYHERHRERLNQKKRELYAASKDARRVKNLMENYGITPEQYDLMFREQGGVCAICGRPEWVVQGSSVRALCVDHDHLTGKVRGLLCLNCNRALGYLYDDVDVLKKAIYYLQKGSE